MGKGLSPLQHRILDALDRWPAADRAPPNHGARPRDIVIKQLGLANTAGTRVAVSRSLLRLSERGLVARAAGSVSESRSTICGSFTRRATDDPQARQQRNRRAEARATGTGPAVAASGEAGMDQSVRERKREVASRSSNDFLESTLTPEGRKHSAGTTDSDPDYNGALRMLKQLDELEAPHTRAFKTVRAAVTRIAKHVDQPCELRPAIRAAAERNKRLRHALDLIGFDR